MTNMAQALASLEITPPATIQTDAAPPWSGIRGLMVAILEDAIHSLKSPQAIVRNAAEQWINSRERRYVFSFAVICETLDFEPTLIRRSVMGLLKGKQRRGRLIKRSRPNVRHTGAIHPASPSRRALTHI